MLVQHRWPCAVIFAVMTAIACTSPGGCGGFQSLPPGTYQGPKLDSAGSFRVSAHGFETLSGSAELLQLLAPGGTLKSSVKCKTSSVLGSDFAVGDQGGVGCTDASCGRGDGECTMLDVPQEISIAVSGLRLTSASPDLIEAQLTASIQTGLIIIASKDKSSGFCIFSGGGQVKCSLDFDSARKTPATNVMTVQIKLAIRNGLLSLELAELAGVKACGTAGASPAPACIDSSDIVIARVAGGCDVCGTLDLALIKQLLIAEMTKSMKDNLTKSLESTTCQPCDPNAAVCPTNATCSVIDVDKDAGRCIETVGGLCSPRFLGLEGRADLSTALGNFGVTGAALDVSLALGGSAVSQPTGATIGMRGGLREVAIAPCVKALPPVTLANLPLPNFELDAPGPYDVAFSLSQQLVSEAMLHAQQSGALCLELGTATVAQLESAALETFLPSLKAFTHGANVPLRVVIRPVNPPTAVIGEGTLDSMGKPLDPLIRLNWPGVEIDIYAQLEERLVRLFTIATDLELPLGLDLATCGSVKPVIGDLKNAVKKVEVKNSELLTENLDVISKLVPTLLGLAEPSLAKGLPAFQLPSLGGSLPLGLKLLRARGVGQITGSSQYQHLGIYASLVSADGGCQ